MTDSNEIGTARAAIRLITIDLDDTLWPCLPVIRRAEEALYGWLQERAGRLTDAYDMEGMHAHRHRLRQERADIAHDITELRRVSLRILLRELGYPEALADPAMTLFLDYRNRVSPYPDVAPVLRALRGRYRLVSVTNGNADVQRSPLRDHFDLWLNAAGVGASKPDPAIFLAALERTGVAPGQALHVGDDPLLDVAAARGIGMQAVWMNRAGADWPADLEAPDGQVKDLYELQDWLK